MSASKASPTPKAGKGGKKVKPLGLTDSPLAHGITRKLFGFYLLITALFSFVLIGYSFYGETTRLEQQARFLGEASLPILGEALWSFDDAQRDAAAEVLLRHQELVGVGIRFLDPDKHPQTVVHGKTIKLPEDAKLSEAIASKTDVFEKTGWMRMPIYHVEAGRHSEGGEQKVLIGELTLFINNQLALKRHAMMTAVVMLIGVLAAIFNWVVFRIVLNRDLAEPFRLIIVKLLQVQKILPETEITPENFRKLKIERFGTEFRLLEKQLEKIIISNLTLAEAIEEAKSQAVKPVATPAEHAAADGVEQDSAEQPNETPDTQASDGEAPMDESSAEVAGTLESDSQPKQDDEYAQTGT